MEVPAIPFNQLPGLTQLKCLGCGKFSSVYHVQKTSVRWPKCPRCSSVDFKISSDVFVVTWTPPDGDRWAPISTAPKAEKGYGVQVELWNGYETYRGFWAGKIGGEDQIEPGWYYRSKADVPAKYVYIDPEPTHWRTIE